MKCPVYASLLCDCCDCADIAESHGGTAECHDAVLSVPLSFTEEQHTATRCIALLLLLCFLKRYTLTYFSFVQENNPWFYNSRPITL